jgi:membrane-associated phospholipid phosphatase
MICIIEMFINEEYPLQSVINLDHPLPTPFIYNLDMIGLFGPIILLLVSIWQLWGNGVYWTASIVIFGMNLFINKILKLWIKQPRPVGGQRMITYETYSGIEQYGMPSGHSQSVVCSVTFLYLVKHSIIGLIIGMYIVSLTIYQRWKYRQHSVEQLSVGAVVGFLVAYIGYTITTFGITGQIKSDRESWHIKK